MNKIIESSLQTGPRQLRKAAGMPLKRAEAFLRSKGKLTYHLSSPNSINAIRRDGVLAQNRERLSAGPMTPGFYTGSNELMNSMKSVATKPVGIEKFVHTSPVLGGRKRFKDIATYKTQQHIDMPGTMKDVAMLKNSGKAVTDLPRKIRTIPYSFVDEKPAFYNRMYGADVMTQKLRAFRADPRVAAKRRNIARHIVQLRSALRTTTDPIKRKNIIAQLSQATGRSIAEASIQSGLRQLRKAASMPLKRAEAHLRSKGKLGYHMTTDDSADNIRKTGIQPGHGQEYQQIYYPNFIIKNPKSLFWSTVNKKNDIDWIDTPEDSRSIKSYRYRFTPKEKLRVLPIVYTGPSFAGRLNRRKRQPSLERLNDPKSIFQDPTNPETHSQPIELDTRMARTRGSRARKFHPRNRGVNIGSMFLHDKIGDDPDNLKDSPAHQAIIQNKVGNFPTNSGNYIASRPHSVELLHHALKRVRDQEVLNKRRNVARQIIKLRSQLATEQDPIKRRNIIHQLNLVTGRHYEE